MKKFLAVYTGTTAAPRTLRLGSIERSRTNARSRKV